MQSDEHLHASHHIKKKRVGKACDSCRIKKTKCDGKKPCNRCILDNKICVFTEKKKQREKHHPNGYIELLETRLDIMTKLFNKLIELSRPHLSFIDEIVEENNKLKNQKQESKMNIDGDASSEESSDEERDANQDQVDVVPINKVISYLINQQGLLRNIPIEWEQGTFIAASFDPNKNLQESVRLFADHKESIPETPSSPPTSSLSSSVKRSSIQVKTEQPSSQMFPQSENINLGLSNTFPSRRSTNELMMSDFDSDFENGNPTNQAGEPLSPPEHFARANTLFIYDAPVLSKTSSISSLTHKYENHTLSPQLSTSSPHSPPFTNATPSAEVLSTIRRSSSSLSHKKLKNSGHITKPSHANNHSNVVTIKREGESSTSPSGSSSSILPSPVTISNPPSLFNQDVRTPEEEIFSGMYDGKEKVHRQQRPPPPQQQLTMLLNTVFQPDPLIQQPQPTSPLEFPFTQPFQSLDMLTSDGMDGFVNGGNGLFGGRY